MICGQHCAGGVEHSGTTEVLTVIVQAGSALKVAVMAFATPLALSRTPTKL